jgi:hypothetical protein
MAELVHHNRRLALLGVMLVVVGGCTRPDTPPPPPPPPPDKVELDLVNDALHECMTLDCERAHAHLTTLPAQSPLRASDSFHAVEYRYDAERLLRADIEPDLTKRMAEYKAVFETPGVDTQLKLAASERIARLGTTTNAATELSVNASVNAVAAAAAEAADLLAKSRSKNPADQAAVRAKLEPRIFTGKATADDVGMLRTVCKAQHDTACITRLDRLILH